MIKLTNLSAHRPSTLAPLTGNEDAFPIIENHVSFVADIQRMMFGLGDVPHPLAESAELVESIVLDQMISLLRQASEVAEIANRDTIAPEDILFIMKRNPKALKRLIIYLGVKDEARIHANLLRPTPEETLPEGFGVESVSHEVDSEEPSVRFSHSERIGLSEWNKGRKKYCLAFLKTIGIDESDLNQVVDIVKETRLNRANNQALSLSSTSYESFHAARCESFCSANMTTNRFLNWICVRGGWKEDISQPVLDILVYLAKETIACIIDMVMTLREELALQTKRTHISSPPISQDEIREVIRRCFFSHATSLSAFSRPVRPVRHRRLIAI